MSIKHDGASFFTRVSDQSNKDNQVQSILNARKESLIRLADIITMQLVTKVMSNSPLLKHSNTFLPFYAPKINFK